MTDVSPIDRIRALKHVIELLQRSIETDESALVQEWARYRQDVTPVPTIPVELYPTYSRLEAKRRYLKKLSRELNGTLRE